MKPLPLDIQTTGSLGGKVIDMTIDPESIAHIMGALTDLYPDREMAVISEYSTNARDAMIAAGKADVPIRITLPSKLHPYFIVEDEGVGMSYNDIEHVFSKYGASTKRDTNDQSGMLGLGCKAALTYTAQFILEAVQDGMKTFVNVSRGSDGTGKLDVLEPVSTNQPDGVKVTIPVEENNDFAVKSKEFFMYWEPGTVLVNGEQPTFFDGIRISDTIMLSNKSLGNDVIVQGGMPYKVDLSHSISGSAWGYTPRAVFWVPVGTVRFTPNRKDLIYDSHTRKVLEKLRNEFKSEAGKAMQKEIDACQSASDAMQKYLGLKNAFEFTSVNIAPMWQNTRIPDVHDMKHIEFKPDAHRHQVFTASDIQSRKLEHCVFIVGMPDIQLSSTYKSKIRKLLSINNLRPKYVILPKEGEVPNRWMQWIPSFTWEEVKAVQVSLPKATSRRVKTRYKVLDNSRWPGYTEVDDIRGAKNIYYGTTTDDWVYSELNAIFDQDDLVVFLSKGSWGTFVREYPHAKTIEEGIEEKRTLLKNSLTVDELDALRIEYNSILRMLDDSKVDDPEVARQIRLSKMKPKQEKKFFALGGAHKFGGTLKSKMRDYPLVDAYSAKHVQEDVYLYINAKYKEKK